MLVLAFLCEGGIAALAVIASWLLDVPLRQQLRPNPAAFLAGIVATVPMLLVFIVILRCPIGPFAEIRHLCNTVLRPLFSLCRIGDLAWISLLAGIGEELLFRGLLQPGLERRFGLALGCLVASLVFGLAHAVTVTYVFLATGFGLYLGWLAHFTDGLVAPMVAHGLYDFLILWYLVAGGTRPDLMPIDAESGLEDPEMFQ